LRCVLVVTNANLDVFGRSPSDPIRNHLFFGLDFCVAASHETLDGINRTFRVGDRLSTCGFTNDRFFFIGESNDTGCQSISFRIGNDFGFTAFHHRDNTVGRAEVDADNLFALCHWLFSFVRHGRQALARRMSCEVMPGVSSVSLATRDELFVGDRRTFFSSVWSTESQQWQLLCQPRQSSEKDPGKLGFLSPQSGFPPLFWHSDKPRYFCSLAPMPI